MTGWLYALALKFIAAPAIMFIYWLLAVRGANLVSRLIPDGKLRRALVKERGM